MRKVKKTIYKKATLTQNKQINKHKPLLTQFWRQVSLYKDASPASCTGDHMPKTNKQTNKQQQKKQKRGKQPRAQKGTGILSHSSDKVCVCVYTQWDGDRDTIA